MRNGAVRKGFTIVELIIVIVVVAILAVLVLVAYNNAVRRAQGAQIVVAAKAWEKIFKTYYAKKESYDALTTAAGCQPYLGLSESEFSDIVGGCMPAKTNQAIMNELKTVVTGTFPKGRLPDLKSSVYGIQYYGSGASKYFNFVQPGNGCPTGTRLGTYTSSINVTSCYIDL